MGRVPDRPSEPTSDLPASRPPSSDLPAPAPPASNLPARRLSATQVEAVLRRAVELQARESDHGASAAEGMMDTELIRIGEELGLSPRHVQQALAETSSDPPPDDAWFGRGFGPGVVQVSRLIPRDAEAVRSELDTYFRERECMVVHRRFPERLVYTQGSGVAASIQRAAAQVGGRYPLLNVGTVETGVRPVDERSCYVAVQVDLRSQRTGYAAGGTAIGTSTGSMAAIFLGIAVAPPAALVGVPVLLGSLLSARAAYRHSVAKMQNQLESLLDRLEHGELVSTSTPSWRKRLGF
jgi:hypothetical protein